MFYGSSSSKNYIFCMFSTTGMDRYFKPGLFCLIYCKGYFFLGIKILLTSGCKLDSSCPKVYIFTNSFAYFFLGICLQEFTLPKPFVLITYTS